MLRRAACALGLLLAAAVPVTAQPAGEPPPGDQPVPISPLDGTEIGELEILGLGRIDEAYVRNQMRTRPGQAYAQQQLQADIGRLLRTGRFRDIEPEVALVEGRVQITLTLWEKPEVRSIEFEGAREFKPKDLQDALIFGPGDPLDSFDVRQGIDAILRLYRDKGYAYAEVTVDEELMETEQRVLYRIIENQRVRVRRITFEGNVTFDDGALAKQLETKRYFPIFRTGNFDPDRAARDIAALQRFYRDRGFLDAEASYVLEFEDVARERLIVIFRINEGTRYDVREIRIEGHNVFTEEDIRGLLHLSVGEPLLAVTVRRDEERIEELYGSNGYIDVIADTSWVFAEEPGEVIVTYTITEGRQFRVGWIEVDGNFQTQEKCVRREVRFYPEEIFDTTKIRDAERRLKGSGLFSEATITALPEGDEPGFRDVLVTVTENERTNQFIAGVGASSDSGLLGNIVLENTNFDLFDTPRTWQQFFRGRAFRGAGQTMRLQLEPGTEFSRFRIDFREPYLMDRRVGFGTSLYLFERGRDGHLEQRAGGNVSFDREFEDGFLEGWIGEIALRAEYVRISRRQAFAAKDIRRVDGGNFITSVKFSLLHDTTDSPFDPSEGHRIRASWEQAGLLGGDFFFSTATGSYTRYWTVAIDEEDRKSVVAVHARGGQIFGSSPVFDRFYAGGIGSFRGFDFRGISPRDGLRNNRVGGDFMLLTGTEYSFPLIGKAIRGVFFMDMGTVERRLEIKDWRIAVGGGIRLTLDIFGTVPMEFDIAIPVMKGPDDNDRIFSFFIGLPFF